MRNDPLIEILKSDFEKRRKRNKAYSLRSFSRDLEIDASNLSKLLTYKKALGPGLKKKLAAKVGFSENDYSTFQVSANIDDLAYNEHLLGVFEIIANSYHYVILELFKLSGFRATNKTIASAIGISVEEAELAINRLLTVGLLKNDPKAGLTPTDNSSSTIISMATSKSHREQQKEILKGAIDALEGTPFELRSQSSMTVAVDSAKLEEAKQLIKTFRRKLGRLLSASKDLDQVYQLSVSLYPVTKMKKEKI